MKIKILSIIAVLSIVFTSNSQSISEFEENYENLFFASETSKYTLASESLKLQKVEFILENDKEFYAGYKFNLKEKNTCFLEFGVRGKFKDGFASITKNGEFTNNFNGVVKFHNIISKDVKIDSNLKNDLFNNYIKFTNKNASLVESDRAIENISHFLELNEQLITNKSYTSAKMDWWSLEVNLPIAKTNYETIKDITKTTVVPGFVSLIV